MGTDRTRPDMQREYDSVTAHHYSAYRPPLHSYILEKCIPQDHFFECGIDFGCGIGHSSLALAKYCRSVIGVDGHQSMLDNSIAHPRITYQLQKTTQCQSPDRKFDIISFAGSLFYLKSQDLLDEVVRIATNQALIIVYDFDLQIEPILSKLIDHKPILKSHYDHSTDFSGLSQNNLFLVNSALETHNIEVSAINMMHILAANYLIRDQIDLHFLNSEDLVQELSRQLITTDRQFFTVEAKLYYTIYRINNKDA